jgi:hypothetical protein
MEDECNLFGVWDFPSAGLIMAPSPIFQGANRNLKTCMGERCVYQAPQLSSSHEA